MKNQIDFPEIITRFRLIKISIMKNQIDFQKCIPLSADKNMNYEEPD